MRFDKPEIMQLNITKKCNMSCYHCHVKAGPNRVEMMDKTTIDKAFELFKKFRFTSLDITGGAPEMNENLEYILEKFSPIADISVRTNLTILLENEYKKYIEIYKKFCVNLIASVPFYEKDFNDAMRGEGSFDKQIEALRILNSNDIYNISLVYNPNGAYLPPKQTELEKIYKDELAKYGIKFKNLLCMVNLPIGRFEKMLKRFDEYDEYIKLLKANQNAQNRRNLMCKSLVNIAYNGEIFDCDFNAALNLPSKLLNIDNALNSSSVDRDIVTATHCLACSSGDGYGCFGSKNE
ncbi:MAG: arsenosugar biosynthesis radical SAM protein ArsS [Campylobacter sp.]|nr:arsenosugar biosynthesis radical SAM protein ArsS [Campylobacter sp.]